LSCESENREGNSEGARDVDEIDSKSSDPTWKMMREKYKNYKQQEERKKRQLEEKPFVAYAFKCYSVAFIIEPAPPHPLTCMSKSYQTASHYQPRLQFVDILYV